MLSPNTSPVTALAVSDFWPITDLLILTNHRLVYSDQLQNSTTTLKTVEKRPYRLEDSVSLRHSRYLGHRGDEGPPVPSDSDFVLRTKLGPPPGTH